jgi:hypothetical protein
MQANYFPFLVIFLLCGLQRSTSLYVCGLGFEQNTEAFYASDFHCTQCPTGKFKNTYGTEICQPCPGNFSSSTTGSHYCDACDKGFKLMFQSTLQCVKCQECYTTYQSTDEVCRPCRVQDMNTDASCGSFTLHEGGCWSTLTKDEIHEHYKEPFHNAPEHKKFENIHPDTVEAYMTDDNLPVGLRLQDDKFLTEARNTWWETRKDGYNGYTYTVGPLLPLGPYLKQAFNSTCGDMEGNTFMNRIDISNKYVDAEFLQSKSTVGKYQPISTIKTKLKRFHTNAAFPVKIHEVDPQIGANYDFSGEVYKALLNILKNSSAPKICAGERVETELACLAWRLGTLWDNSVLTLASYELEEEIRLNIPPDKDRTDHCEQDDPDDGYACYDNCFSCSICEFGYDEPNEVYIKRRMRNLYNAINYTLYNATILYEAASEDIRDWEQKNSGFKSCEHVSDPISAGVDIMNITLNFPPEANGRVKEIGIYTVLDNQKNFSLCNHTMSGVTMSAQIPDTSEFYLRVHFRENHTTYNVTIEHGRFVSTFQALNQTFSSTHQGAHFVAETLQSVAVDWKLQTEACAQGSTDEIQTLHDFNSLHAKMKGEFEMNQCTTSGPF